MAGKLQKGKKKAAKPAPEEQPYYQVFSETGSRYDYPTEVSAVMFALSNSYTVGYTVYNKRGETVAVFHPRLREVPTHKAPSGPELQQRAKEAREKEVAKPTSKKKLAKPLKKRG